MGAVLLAARLVLSIVLVVAGIAKLGDRAGTRQAMRDFGVPGPLAPVLGLLLPLAELGAGLALLPVATAWWGAVAALVLLTLFLAVIGYSLARGRRPDCHCFGQLHSAPIGSRTVIRNLVLTGLAALIVAQPGRDPGPGLLSLTGGVTPAMATAIGIALVALAAAAVNGWLLTNLLRQNGRLLLRLDALEERLRAPGSQPQPTAAAAGAAPGSAVGSPAPHFALPSLDGDLVSLDRLRSAGKSLLLLFVDPGCGPCATLLPEVAGWQRDHADRFTVALVSRGKRERNLKKIAPLGVRPVLLQAEYEVSERYGTVATPSAIMVDAAGRIASPVAAGAEAIRRLVEDVSRPTLRRPPGALAVGAPAPPLRLPELDGTSLDLTDRLGRSTILLFWNPGCGFCRQLLPELQAWAGRNPRPAADLVLVSTPEVEANRESGLPGPVLLDEGFAAGRAFGAGGTPSAVLVDAAGRVGAPLAVGGEAVLQLLAALSPTGDALAASAG